MNEQQMLDIIRNSQFNNQEDEKDPSKLITNNPNYKGFPLYKKEYDGGYSFKAVFGNELKRLGFSAIAFHDKIAYEFPLIANSRVFASMLPKYRACKFLDGWAENEDDADKLARVMKTLSTTLGFQGKIVKSKNIPNKKFPASFKVQMSKNLPYKVDYDESLDFAMNKSWETIDTEVSPSTNESSTQS